MYPELYKGAGGQRQEFADFGRKWGWYQNIYALAGGDIFKIDDVTELKLLKALTFLSFEAEKNKIEQKILKER